MRCLEVIILLDSWSPLIRLDYSLDSEFWSNASSFSELLFCISAAVLLLIHSQKKDQIIMCQVHNSQLCYGACAGTWNSDYSCVCLTSWGVTFLQMSPKHFRLLPTLHSEGDLGTEWAILSLNPSKRRAQTRLDEPFFLVCLLSGPLPAIRSRQHHCRCWNERIFPELKNLIAQGLASGLLRVIKSLATPVLSVSCCEIALHTSIFRIVLALVFTPFLASCLIVLLLSDFWCCLDPIRSQ